MILYTPLAMEEVLARSEETAGEPMYVSHNGKYFCVNKRQSGYQLVSISSTDPNDYMNNNYSPGTYI